MRVSFVLPVYFSHPVGGYRVVYEYANYLVREGHQVTIIYPRDIGVPTRRAPLQPARDLLWPYKVRLKNRPLVKWMELDPRVKIRLIARFYEKAVPDGDVIVATAWQTAKPVADLPPAKGKKLYLVQDHEVWPGNDPDEVNATFALDMRIIAISTWLAEVAAEHGARDLRVIHNGLDHAVFNVTSNPADRAASILALFHHEKRKDVKTAAEALTRVHQLHPTVPVTMFGVPHRDASIPEWMAYVRLPSPSALRSLYNDHSIFLSSSLLEGWCLPALEAMACGCAFVGTDSKGPRDFCVDEESALLSPPGDAASLARNLDRVIDDAAFRRRLQANGTQGVHRFTWENAGRLFVEAMNGPEDNIHRRRKEPARSDASEFAAS